MKNLDLKKMHYISIIWGIIMLLLVLGLTVIAIIYKKETDIYKQFETNLETKTQEYIEKNSLYPTEEQRYSVEQLLQEQVIETNIINDHECDGYVIVDNQNQTFSYNAYVKCGSYKTLGYKK